MDLSKYSGFIDHWLRTLHRKMCGHMKNLYLTTKYQIDKIPILGQSNIAS